MCKHNVALVKWDEEFNYADSHVPLNPRVYDSEAVHLGWNMLNRDFAVWERELAVMDAELAEETEQLQGMDDAMAAAVEDAMVVCGGGGAAKK